MDLNDSTSYGGGSWRRLRRARSFREDKNAGCPWRDVGVNCEWSRLQEVVLRVPGGEMEFEGDPDRLLFLEKPHSERLRSEILELARLFEDFGVVVRRLEEPSSKPNLIFMRDLFWATEGLTFVARPATSVRAGEESIVAAALSRIGAPIHCVHSGVFEASDLLFLQPNRVIFGIGDRSEIAALDEILSNCPFLQLAGTFRLPPRVQHLLGIVNIVSEETALVREIAPDGLIAVLKSVYKNVLVLQETDEVKYGQAMNVVCLKPGTILMPDDCPQTQRIYERAGLNVIGARAVEIRKGAGGFACVVGILSRDLVRA